MHECIICECPKETPYLDWIDGEWFSVCEDCHDRYYIDCSLRIV